jgi:hypothetical protein
MKIKCNSYLVTVPKQISGCNPVIMAISPEIIQQELNDSQITLRKDNRITYTFLGYFTLGGG